MLLNRNSSSSVDNTLLTVKKVETMITPGDQYFVWPALRN